MRPRESPPPPPPPPESPRPRPTFGVPPYTLGTPAPADLQLNYHPSLLRGTLIPCKSGYRRISCWYLTVRLSLGPYQITAGVCAEVQKIDKEK